MSLVIKGLQKLSFHPSYRFIRRASNVLSKELIRQTSAPTTGTDLLLNNLKNAKSVNNLFEIVNSHHQIMNNRHSIQALRSLFALHKQSRGEISTQDILRHEDFETLCKHLRQQSGIIDLRDTVDALKILTYVGVPSDSLICQVLLQLIRQSVNHLSLPQIIFLDFLFKQLKSTPLVDALQIALPIVFEVQLPTKMDTSKISYLAEYFHYISKKNVSEKCVELMMNTILKNREEWDGKTSVSILWSICDMKPNWRYKQILERTFNSILVHVDSIPYEDLDTSLTKLVHRYNNKMNFYYNEDFFDAVGNVVIQEDCTFEQAVYTLKKFLRINHIHNELLDYISEKCHINPNLITNGNPFHVFILIGSVAMTEYRPKHWLSMQNAFVNIHNFDSYLGKEFLLGLASALCVLDIYNVNILKMVLDLQYLQTLFNKQSIADFEKVVLLYQAITTFKPELADLLPDKNIMEEIMLNLNQTKDSLLEACLYKILGGERYVKSNIRTKSFHFIDHVIVLRKGGYPVAINTAPDYKYLENIEAGPESQIVAIVALHPWHYTVNCRRQKGSSLLMLKTLEAKGCAVVPICMELWNSLPEYERIPYIAEALKSKSGYKEQLTDFMS